MSDHDESNAYSNCKSDVSVCARARARLPAIAEALIDHCRTGECFTHVDDEPLPAESRVIDLIEKFREVLFPGYFTREKIDPVNFQYYMGQTVSLLYDRLAELVTHNIRHDCLRYDLACSDCEKRGREIALIMLEAVSELRGLLAGDVRAAFEGDPAATCHDEIIFSYPGIYAMSVYRVAHKLYDLQVPLLPRIMTEHAHSVTGIDIHPGAVIGERFVIDHGTGVVIGETARIGRNVRVYQGVTLGALSLPKDAGDRLRGKKRHPAIEDDVIIYSGATILGGDTVIGARSVIGGNVWITESVPPDTTVLMEPPRLIYK
ncbi:MAG: serine acetyltransferase [Deltaproteobacteria bacterium]|jgi:serine O-acetyltransferase|nr:serine acetyltransferase [Syntrophaceae bacterium]